MSNMSVVKGQVGFIVPNWEKRIPGGSTPGPDGGAGSSAGSGAKSEGPSSAARPSTERS